MPGVDVGDTGFAVIFRLGVLQVFAGLGNIIGAPNRTCEGNVIAAASAAIS